MPAMPRLELDVPDALPFSTTLEVRVTDLNYAGHMGNDRFLTLAHEARTHYLRELGATEADVFGTRLIIADAAIRYRAEAFAGDRLRWALGFGVPGRVGCDLWYRVTREGDGVLVAELKTGLVFLTPDGREKAPVPSAIRSVAASA